MKRLNPESDNEDTTNKIRVTYKNNDGRHLWKGKKEIITGYDWMSLNEKEKLKLVQLEKDRLESKVILKFEKSTQEYVDSLNNYFSEKTNQN